MNTLTDCLGREREVTRYYPDGSFDCPFCTVAAFAERQETRCSNPGCPASSYCFNASGHPKPEVAATFRQKIAEQERREREAREERERAASVAAYARERHREHEAWIAAQYNEARRRGACTRCVIQPGWERSRFVRHRGVCPKAVGR